MAETKNTYSEVSIRDINGNMVFSKPIELTTSCEGIPFSHVIRARFREMSKLYLRDLPKRYIINENACICFWKDGTKTVSKRREHDEFDKEIGFLFCCYQHYYEHLSRNKREKIISWIDYEHIKNFLMEIFIEKNKFTEREAKVYLRDLKVEKKKVKEEKKQNI